MPHKVRWPSGRMYVIDMTDAEPVEASESEWQLIHQPAD